MLSIPRPDRDRPVSLANVIFATYTLFLAGFYFVPNAVDLYKFYIWAVFLPGLFLLRATLGQAAGSRIWVWLVAYLTYMLLSSFWSADFSLELLWRDFRYVLYILGFVLLTVYFFARDPALMRASLLLTTGVVIAAAAVSIILFEPARELPLLTDRRLAGVGITENMNPSAFVYGFFGVLALHYTRHLRGAGRYFFGLGFAVIVLFVVLTQSNTGLLALTSACAVLLLVSGKRALVGGAIGLALALVTGLYLAWSLGLFSGVTDAGFMRRLPIWEHVVGLWREAPIFGNGWQKTVLLNAAGKSSHLNYAHSVFLATLRDGGLVGLALLLPVYALALGQGVRRALAGRGSLYLALFTFGVVCVLVDVDQVVTRPRELWIILWLPLACLIASELGLADDADSRTHPAKNIA